MGWTKKCVIFGIYFILFVDHMAHGIYVCIVECIFGLVGVMSTNYICMNFVCVIIWWVYEIIASCWL